MLERFHPKITNKSREAEKFNRTILAELLGLEKLELFANESMIATLCVGMFKIGRYMYVLAYDWTKK